MDVQIYIILFNSTTNNDLLYLITPNILPKSPAIADTNQSVRIFLDPQLDICRKNFTDKIISCIFVDKVNKRRAWQSKASIASIFQNKAT